jgi:uncharacterized protein (TIGR02145 family)
MSCSDDPVSSGSGGDNTGTVTDIDGNVYNTIKIGDQWWMAENLKVTRYRNGDDIPNVTLDSEWAALSTGAYCSYQNNSGNETTYGLLYNWYALEDSRNIAPDGWHVPTDEEWKELEMSLGMSQEDADNTGVRGTNQGSQLADNSDLWESGSLETNGAFGSSGFAALPCGQCDPDGQFGFLGFRGYFWNISDLGGSIAWARVLDCYEPNIQRIQRGKRSGLAVRCVKD